MTCSSMASCQAVSVLLAIPDHKAAAGQTLGVGVSSRLGAEHNIPQPSAT